MMTASVLAPCVDIAHDPDSPMVSSRILHMIMVEPGEAREYELIFTVDAIDSSAWDKR